MISAAKEYKYIDAYFKDSKNIYKPSPYRI